MTKRLFLVAVLGLAGLAVTAVSGAAAARSSGDAASAGGTVTVRSSQWGRILFDKNRRALYAFTRDPRGKTVCNGACAVAWPPYIASGRLRAGAGAKTSLLGTTKRRDGKRQVTYAGRALYYYVGDRKPGEVRCQNVFEFGGLWLVMRPNGRLVR